MVACGIAAGGCRESPAGGSDGGVQLVDPSFTTEVTVTGDVDSTMGIFDPSLVYPAGAAQGLMSYSSVPSQVDIHTHLAVSTDRGASWTLVGEVNAPSDDTLTFAPGDADCPLGTCAVRVIHEVSSLIDDPGDAARRYKIFTHTYATLPRGAGVPPKLRPDVGYLSLYTAPAPAGPWQETKLIGWRSASFFSSTGMSMVLGQDLPALADCLALTEPAALLDASGIALAVGCGFPQQGQPVFRQELLRSTDHAVTFSHVGTLLTAGDGSLLGSPGGVNAGDLFTVGGAAYLIVSPGGEVTAPGIAAFPGYAGCDVLPVELATASVSRSGSNPVVVRALKATNNTFSGACTYADGATTMGYVVSILGAAPRLFRIYATGVPGP